MVISMKKYKSLTLAAFILCFLLFSGFSLFESESNRNKINVRETGLKKDLKYDYGDELFTGDPFKLRGTISDPFLKIKNGKLIISGNESGAAIITVWKAQGSSPGNAVRSGDNVKFSNAASAFLSKTGENLAFDVNQDFATIFVIEKQNSATGGETIHFGLDKVHIRKMKSTYFKNDGDILKCNVLLDWADAYIFEPI